MTHKGKYEDCSITRKYIKTVYLNSLTSVSKYKAAQRLYEKAGFVNTDRYNDNQYADIFMKLEL